MSLPETLDALYALQQIDTRIDRATKAYAALDTGAKATAEADAARRVSQQKRDALHKSAGELKDSELKLSALETKQKSYQNRLYEGKITNVKELGNIEKEIAALGRQRSDLDSRILELMDAVETAQGEGSMAEKGAQAADAHAAEVKATSVTRAATLKTELTELTKQRAEAAASVTDAALMKRYEQIRGKFSGLGIVKIDGNSCGGCHLAIPSGVIKSVKDGAQAQTCENCGRLLTL